MTTFEICLHYNCVNTNPSFSIIVQDEPTELTCLELIREYCKKNNVDPLFVQDNAYMSVEAIFNDGELFGDPVLYEIDFDKIEFFKKNAEALQL